MLERRTKIVATLGPATDPPGMLDALAEAGMDCARVNCSHGGGEDLLRRAAAVREVAARHRGAIGLLFDLQGPKLRLAADTHTRTLERGDTVTFTGNGAGGEDTVTVDFDGFTRLCTERSEIVIGDGVPRFAVTEVREAGVRARVVSPGPLSPRKGVNVTYARPELPAITEKDLADLAVAVEAGADFVALSFVRSAADLVQLRERLQELGSHALVIAKIEKVEAYEHLDEILAVSDGVMVARGDYGVEAGVARVPLMQKDTIARATKAGKLVITATQMLESMIQTAEPTRAEAADIANAVIDGTSAVMLSAETSVGRYPVEAVRAMAEIACAAEEAPEIHGRATGRTSDTAAAAVMHAAVELADEVGADALVIPTATGGGVRACAKYRPRRPVVALSHVPGIPEQLALEWGVFATWMDAAETVDELIDAALAGARDEAGLPPGAICVITAGRIGIAGATNLIMIREIPEP
ncbi:MAG: pyruvate kinase [Solirubrobacteraceae bacterium]|nr:pyruvate kinase [Solirubrobacteraceae bacterium]